MGATHLRCLGCLSRLKQLRETSAALSVSKIEPTPTSASDTARSSDCPRLGGHKQLREASLAKASTLVVAERGSKPKPESRGRRPKRLLRLLELAAEREPGRLRGRS